MIQESFVCDTSAALGMKIEQEFIVVSLSSGKFFHFTPESESFFSFFRTPQRLQAFFEAFEIDSDERRYLEDFCRRLVNEGILAKGDSFESAPPATKPQKYVRPSLLKEGEKRLAEFEFSYP